MKYLKVFESFFKDWEEISKDDWNSTSNWENMPLSDFEFDTLIDFLIGENKKLMREKDGDTSYSLDYKYVNPNKMGFMTSNRPNAWMFQIQKSDIDNQNKSSQRSYTIIHVSIFKKRESESSNSVYLMHYVDHRVPKGGFYESDTFASLMDLVKKHLEL